MQETLSKGHLDGIFHKILNTYLDLSRQILQPHIVFVMNVYWIVKDVFCYIEERQSEFHQMCQKTLCLFPQIICNLEDFSLIQSLSL